MELEAGTFCVIPIKAARAAALSPTAGWVLAQLWDHKNREGRCWPSIATLAREAGVSRGSVFKALDELEDKGFVRKVQRLGDRNVLNTNEYTVLIPVAGVVQDLNGVGQGVDRGGTQDEQRTKPTEPNPVTKDQYQLVYEVWEKKMGKLPWGRFVKALKEVIRELGSHETASRLTSYLSANEPRFCSPEGFAARYKAYGTQDGFRSTVQPVTTAETGHGDY